MRKIISIISAVLVLSLSFNSYASVNNSVHSDDYVYGENPYETYFPKGYYVVFPDLIEGHKEGVTTINYDSANRSIQILYTYDLNGNITSVTNGSVYKNNMNEADFAALPDDSKEDYLPAVQSTYYSYNEQGQLATLDYDRVVSVMNEGKQQGHDSISYKYNNAGQLVSASIKGYYGRHADNYELKYKYNSTGQITEVMHYYSDCPRYKKEYSYDSLNRVTQIRNMVSLDLKKFDSKRVSDFVYDEYGRVVSYGWAEYYCYSTHSDLMYQYVYTFNYDEHGYINSYIVASPKDNKEAAYAGNNVYDSLGRIISRSFTCVSGGACKDDYKYTLEYIY